MLNVGGDRITKKSQTKLFLLAVLFLVLLVLITFAINETNQTVNVSISNISLENLSVASNESYEKLTLTTLENLDIEQEVIIEFETDANLSKWENKLNGKKLGHYISKKAKKDEILSLLSDDDVIKIWPNRVVNITLTESGEIVGAYEFHSSFEGVGVDVCVLDTGVDVSHSMFFETEIISADFTGEGFFDGHGHGTHVSTTLLGKDANYTGIAPGATLYAGKVLDSSGSGLLSWVINGIDWCIANNVDVISMSLGATYSEEPEELLDSPEVLKVKEAVDAGIIVVIASGNSGDGMVTTPGISLDAITVGAVTKDLELASFTGRDLINGVVKPDVVAPGVDICAGVHGGYACMTGTSMATPIVGGLSALLIESGVGDVKQYLMDNSVDIGLDFGLAHVEIVEEVNNSLPQILDFSVKADFVDDGARFYLIVNNSDENILYIEDDVISFNSSFLYELDRTGVYDYRLTVSNINGEVVREGSFEVKDYKLIIPEFYLGVADSLILYHKNLDVKQKIPVSISIKDLDGFAVKEWNRNYKTGKTHQYKLEFTPQLPGKYKVFVEMGTESVETTLSTRTPLMVNTIGLMQVKIR